MTKHKSFSIRASKIGVGSQHQRLQKSVGGNRHSIVSRSIGLDFQSGVGPSIRPPVDYQRSAAVVSSGEAPLKSQGLQGTCCHCMPGLSKPFPRGPSLTSSTSTSKSSRISSLPVLRIELSISDDVVRQSYGAPYQGPRGDTSYRQPKRRTIRSSSAARIEPSAKKDGNREESER